MTTVWPEVRLGDVVVEAKPGFASGHDLGEGVFQFRMNNLTRDGHFDLSKRRRVPSDTKKIDSFLLRSGDVLFNATNSPELVGKSAYIGDLDEPAVFSNHFLRIRVDTHRLAPRFLWRWLQLQWQRGLFRSRARQWVNQAAYGREALVELQIPLPPIDEQRRIAAVLDQADELRAKRQTSLALLDSLDESIFLDMFGDPSTWARAERPLIELVDPDRPISYGILKPGPHIQYGVPYVRVVDMRLGGVDSQSVKRTSPEISHQYRRSLLRPGDLLLSIRGHVGRLAEVPEELDGANITQDTARLAIKEANPRFVLQFLRTSWARRWMDSNVKGAAVRGINLGDVKRLPVPVFERSAQDEFVRRVRSAEGTALAQRRAGDGLDELFSSLQHRAFTGQL